MEFEIQRDGRLRYANNSNYKNAKMIRKQGLSVYSNNRKAARRVCMKGRELAGRVEQWLMDSLTFPPCMHACTHTRMQCT